MYVEFYDRLKSLRQSMLEAFVFQLMLDGKIEFHKIAELHAEHMETLRRGQSEHLLQAAHDGDGNAQRRKERPKKEPRCR